MIDDGRIEELQRRVALDPTSTAFAALAEEYRRAGRPQAAVDVCRAGLTRHPVYLSARLVLGRALLDLNDPDGAEAELLEVLQRAPDNLAATRALADVQQLRRALPCHSRVSNVIPFQTDVLMPVHSKTSGPVLTSLDRFLDAIVTLKREAV
jgi:tetratricopeptide (TPR) repeat protein